MRYTVEAPVRRELHQNSLSTGVKDARALRTSGAKAGSRAGTHTLPPAALSRPRAWGQNGAEALLIRNSPKQRNPLSTLHLRVFSVHLLEIPITPSKGRVVEKQ